MIARLALAGLLILAACAPAPLVPVTSDAQGRQDLALPPMKAFGSPRPVAPARPNGEIARDFLDLTFLLESGREVPRLTRFDGPITVRLTGNIPPTAQGDAARVLARIRKEAGLAIAQTRSPDASVTIEFLPRARMQAVVPQAACFVVPRIANWNEFRRARRSEVIDWTTLTRRDRVAIFIPSDTSPQEVRDCLHEELAQALGPLNDLYRLPDSVFNDDNFHAVLTGFDMLILRLTYAPDLSNGMSRSEVAAQLPALLARLNPRGERPFDPGYGTPTPRSWITAMETALGARSGRTERRIAARRASVIAQDQGWTDARAAFSWFALARLSLGSDLDTALGGFLTAAELYRRLPGTGIQTAHIEMQLAAFALSSGQPNEAIALVNDAIPTVLAAENAALLASLLMIKAAALDAQGRTTEARIVRVDSLGWARYGFDDQTEIRARLSEIAALSPIVRTTNR